MCDGLVRPDPETTAEPSPKFQLYVSPAAVAEASTDVADPWNATPCPATSR